MELCEELVEIGEKKVDSGSATGIRRGESKRSIRGAGDVTAVGRWPARRVEVGIDEGSQCRIRLAQGCWAVLARD